MIESGDTITVIIPGEPVAKGRGRIGIIDGRPIIYTPSKTKKYETMVYKYARDVMAGRAPLGCPLYVKMFFYLPIPQSKSKAWKEAAKAGELIPTCRPDTDNFVKAILDGCNGIVWIDDVQVTDMYAKKRYADIPHAKIIVHPLAKLSSQSKPKDKGFSDAVV